MYKSPVHNVVTFSSPAEFGQYALETKLKNPEPFRGQAVNFLSAEQSAELAIIGDDSQVEAAQKMIDKYDIHIDRTAFFDMPSVAGCYPCVPEALAGEPECMREPVLIESDTAPITFVVDTTCSASISGESMTTRGIAILAVIMAVAAIRPLTLKIISCSYGYKNSEGDAYSIIAIDIPTTPLDLASAGYAITNVALARHLMYGYAMKYQGFNGRWPDFRGIKYDDVESEAYKKKMIKYLELEGDVVFIPPSFSENGIITNPEEWIKEQLAPYQSE